MPNLFAQIVLYSWPLVTWFLFRRLRPTLALPATIVLGYLFIPELVGYDPPLLPPIDKNLMPGLCAAVMLWLMHREERRAAVRAARKAGEPVPRPSRGRSRPAGSRVRHIVPMIMVVLLCAPVLTWASNQFPLIYGRVYLPAIAPYDIGSMIMTVVALFIPFFLARHYMGSRDAEIDLLKVLVWSAFAYSFLVLWEARMSPQLNVNLYGFFAHSFIQHIRSGAFRPIVFLEHGLRVGIFLAIAVVAACVLARINADGRRRRWLGLSVWLFVCLLVSRNMGATMIVCIAAPAVLFLPVRMQFVLGMVTAVIVLVYPMARGAGWIPTADLVAQVQSYNADRAQSLEFRLENEDILLAHANQKPVAGWGPWGRSRVYDTETGRDLSVTDGSWIVIIGVYGWVGYLGQFGLLCLPAIFSALRYRRFGMDALESGTILVLCTNLVDLIPNSSLVPVLWLIAGATWARLETASRDAVIASHARGPRARVSGSRPAHTPDRVRPGRHGAKVAPS